MSYSSLLAALRIAGLNSNAAGEVFSYLANTGANYAAILAALQNMGCVSSGGAERLAYDITAAQGYAEILAALRATGAAKDGAGEILALELSSLVAMPPGAPFIWYDAQNIDGLNNTSLVDGQVIGTWVNLGSAGAGGNALQATAGLRPFFRQVATPGKIGNKSAVESDGTRFMASGVITTVPQPVVTAIVWRSTNLAALVAIVDSTGLREMISVTNATGALNMYAGTGPVATGQSITAATWNTILANFNGASSNGRLNGVAGGTINVNTQGNGGITLFAAAGGSSVAVGMIEEVLCYADGTSPAAIEAYITAKIGANPQ